MKYPRSKYPIIIIFLILVSSCKLYGQEEAAYIILPWVNFTTYGLYDFQNKKFTPSFDLNTTLFFVFNGGVEYKNITYIDSKKISGYVGLGYSEYAQVQVGFSKDGTSLRLRSDFPKTSIRIKKRDYDKDYKINTNMPINISVIAERYFKNPNMNWFVGIGIGITLFPPFENAVKK